MKSKRFKQLVLAGLLSSAIIFGGTVEAGVVTDRLPLTCYVDHQVNTYNSPGASTRAGYISANTDLIYITQIRSDGWAYGSYPTSRGRINRWFRISDLCADTGYSNRSVNVKGNQIVYTTKSSGNKLGSVSNGESVIVIADNGNRAQIVYRLNNGSGYKMGWVASSAVSQQTPVRKKGDMNGDGNVDGTDVELLKKYYFDEGGRYVSYADIDNNGKIDLYDVMKLTEEVYDVKVTLNVPMLKQTDIQWKKYKIGNNTIGGIGCTVTSLTMIYNYHNHTNMTPPQMVEKLRPFGGKNGNDINWDNVKYRLGYNTTNIVNGRPSLNNEWLAKIYEQLKNGRPVMIGAYDYHWVVVTGYIGNSKTNFKASDFTINDPSNPFTNLQQFINKYNGGLRGIVY